MIRRTAMVSAVAVVFVQAVSLSQTLILARVLSPVEVGIFYSGTVLTAFLASFSEGGMKQALIQRREDVEQAATTVFWATLAMSLVWACAAVASAPLIARIFHDERAGQVAAVTAGAVVLHALTSVPDALLQRNFDVRQRMFVQPSTAGTFAVTSVVLALAGLGVWALVIAYYLSILVWLSISWSLAQWRPRRGLTSYRIWREMARFGFPLVVRNVTLRVKDIFDAAVAGDAMGTSGVGNYRYGSRLGLLTGVVIVEIGSYVLFPAFSRTATDPQRFRSSIIRALKTLWIVATPVAALTALFGVPLVVILLGSRWHDAAVMFAAMAGCGLGVAMSAVGMESIKGAGRSSLLNWVTGTQLVLGAVLVLSLVRYGLVGMGLALSLTAIVGGGTELWLAHRVADIPGRTIGGILIGPLLAALLAAPAWYWVGTQVIYAHDNGTFVGLLVIALASLGYLATYLVLLLTFVPWARPFPRIAVRTVKTQLERRRRVA